MNDKKNQRQKYTNKIFFLGLEIIVYFGLPAVFGIVLGDFLEKKYNLNANIPILFGTYIVSWVIVFFRYRNISKNFKKNNSN